MVKIGNLTVNPYDIAQFIVCDKGNTHQAIIEFRSGSEQVALEGTAEECNCLFESDLCKQISNRIREGETQEARRRVFE